MLESLMYSRAYPIDQYPCKTRKAAAIMMMIMNNLDPRVAQFPQELITYGGNGQVFSNWAQFLLVMNYLSNMNENQTLVMYSGHPMGLFPSFPHSPRCIITNGMVKFFSYSFFLILTKTKHIKTCVLGHSKLQQQRRVWKTFCSQCHYVSDHQSFLWYLFYLYIILNKPTKKK